MLEHLSKNRESDKFRGFSYRKKLVDRTRTKVVIYPSGNKGVRHIKSKVIAWDVMFHGKVLTEFDTLKEVKHYINEKANT